MLLFLPEEILIHVLVYLELPDIISLFSVCKTLHRLSSDDTIWKFFFKSRYYTLQIDETTLEEAPYKDWKYLFFNKSTLENKRWERKVHATTLIENSILEVTCMTFDDDYVVVGGGVSDSIDFFYFPQLILQVWDFDPAALVVPKTVQVHDIQTGKKVKTLTGHLDSITSVLFKGDTIISGSKDREIRIWKRKGPKWSKKTKIQVHELTGHNRAICCMHWKDNILVSGGKDKVIKIWDLSTNLCVSTLQAETTTYGIWIDDDKIFGGGKDKKIRMWDLETGTLEHTWKGHKGWVSCVQGRHGKLVSGSSDGKARMWDVKSGECARVYKIDNSVFSVGWVTCLQFDENKIVAGTADRVVKILDIVSGRNINTLKAHYDAVTGVQFDDNKILTSSLDRSVRVWDFSRSSSTQSTKYRHRNDCLVC